MDSRRFGRHDEREAGLAQKEALSALSRLCEQDAVGHGLCDTSSTRANHQARRSTLSFSYRRYFYVTHFDVTAHSQTHRMHVHARTISRDLQDISTSRGTKSDSTVPNSANQGRTGYTADSLQAGLTGSGALRRALASRAGQPRRADIKQKKSIWAAQSPSCFYTKSLHE